MATFSYLAMSAPNVSAINAQARTVCLMSLGFSASLEDPGLLISISVVVFCGSAFFCSFRPDTMLH